MFSESLSKRNILEKFHENYCLDVRHLAGLCGVEADEAVLWRMLHDLAGEGRIRRIGGRGRRTSFMVSSFER